MGCTWAVLTSLRRFYGDSIELYGPRMGRSISPLRRLYGGSIELYGPLYSASAVSMVVPILPYGLRLGRSILPPPFLW